MAKLDLSEKWRADREITEPTKYGETFLNAMQKARYGDLSKEDRGIVLKVAGLAAAAGVAVAGAPYAQKVVDDAGDNVDHIYNELMDTAHSNIPIQMMSAYMLAEMMLKDAVKTGNSEGEAGKPQRIDSIPRNTGSDIAKAVPPVVAGAAASGCMDDKDIEDIAEPVDKTIIYVYQKGLSKEGSPQDIIDNQGLYALVDESKIPGAEVKEVESGGDEKGGEPVPIPCPTPVSRYAIEKNLDTGEISIYDAEDNLVNPSDIPDNWKDFIVKDEYGVPITDVSKLLYIDEVGKNKYEIKGLPQEMEDPDGNVWRISHEMGNKYSGDTIHNDKMFKIGDGIDEMFGGFARGEDDKVYGVIVVDEDVFEMYGGDYGTHDGTYCTVPVVKPMCTDTEKGIYIYIYDLSKIPEDGVSVGSPRPQGQEMHIAIENGGFAQLRFVKEKL